MLEFIPILDLLLGVVLGGILPILEKHSMELNAPTKGRAPLANNRSRKHASWVTPFHDLALPNQSLLANAGYIVGSLIKSFVISHSHLDHIAGLVISSASDVQSKKCIYASESTLQDLQNHVFNGRIWPNMLDTGENPLGAYSCRSLDTSKYVSIGPGLSAIAHSVTHGTTTSNNAYDSCAFFIRNDATNKEMLFWGDVGPDSQSTSPRNRAVWKSCAEKILNGTLDTIFLECSYTSSRPAGNLYGHLSPPFVMEELRVLADLVESSRSKTSPSTAPLSGTKIVTIHVKVDVSSDQPTDMSTSAHIHSQLCALEVIEQLGVEFIHVHGGVRLEF